MVVTEKMAMLEILEKRYKNTTLKLLFFKVEVNFFSTCSFYNSKDSTVGLCAALVARGPEFDPW